MRVPRWRRDCTRKWEGTGELGGDDAVARGSHDGDCMREREEPGAERSIPGSALAVPESAEEYPASFSAPVSSLFGTFSSSVCMISVSFSAEFSVALCSSSVSPSIGEH